MTRKPRHPANFIVFESKEGGYEIEAIVPIARVIGFDVFSEGRWVATIWPETTREMVEALERNGKS